MTQSVNPYTSLNEAASDIYDKWVKEDKPIIWYFSGDLYDPFHVDTLDIAASKYTLGWGVTVCGVYAESRNLLTALFTAFHELSGAVLAEQLEEDRIDEANAL